MRVGAGIVFIHDHRPHAFRKVGAFPVPGTSLDAALLATLQPGSYSVQVAGVTAENGLVIVEVYEVP